MTKKERYINIIEHFKEHMPEAQTELHYSNEYELIVAVILSAQCTDKRVNMVTPMLFEQFPDFESLSNATFEAVFALIKSISYPNNKSKNLIEMAKMAVKDFNHKLPHDRDELQKLPGVGRKTANVLASVLFNQPTMAVDTHVFRVSHRLGLASKKSTTPLSVENELVKNIPEEYIPLAHHWLILHGRYICKAQKPNCNTCEIKQYCLYFEKQMPKMSK